jgi:hypothetical protein
MTRILFVLLFINWWALNSATAQSFAPRSADYVFAATANDARAIWVNPAGLAVVPEASIMAEIVLQRPVDQDLRLSQLTFGFNSQGLSFGYNRERLLSNSSNHTYRFALARALRAWTLGFAVSHFRAGRNDTGFDVGIRYRLIPSIQFGAVIRNIGQPQLRNDILPITGVAGVGWTLLPRLLVVTGEAIAANRLEESGYDMAYRAGAQITFGRTLPVAGMTAVTLDENFGVTTWWLGVSLGALRQGVLVAALAPDDPSMRFESVSVAGIARNPLSARRR